MVRDTSILAYNEIKDCGLLSEKRWEVYQCLFNYGPMTGAEVSVRLRTPGRVSETVRNRITELVQMGVVQELGEKPCPITGRTVLVFDVTSDLPRTLSRKATKREKLSEINRDLIKFAMTHLRPDQRIELNAIAIKIQEI